MIATYNLWLVALSLAVAIAVSYTALRLAGRIHDGNRPGGRLWLCGGAVSMGVGIWAMHFIGMLAFSVPIPLHYHIGITLASLIIAMVTSGFALAIAGHCDLSRGRLACGSVLMGAGISAMHYTGMAAVQIVPDIHYNPMLVAASVAIAVAASFAALWLFFHVPRGKSWLSHLVRIGAAIVMGIAITGMHYTGMAAMMLDPRSFCVGGGTLDSSWLAVTIALVALAVLAITLITSVFDAHLDSQTRLDAVRLGMLNAELQKGKKLLALATRAAGIASWEYDVLSAKMLWTENEITALRAAGLNMAADPQAILARLHPEDVLTAMTELRAAVAERQEVCRLRLRVMTREDRAVTIQVHARVFCDAGGRLTRLLGVCWDVSEQVQQDERRATLQSQLREVSRQAGMAEVATGVLHSIGNVLNSLGVSADMLNSQLLESRCGSVLRVAGLLHEHAANLGDFLQHDSRGQKLPAYLQQLGEQLVTERERVVAEARAIGTHVQHIAEIVGAQQSYARGGGFIEEVDVAELVDSAVALNFSADKSVRVKRSYDGTARVTLDRHKLLQILTNLLGNAHHALRDRAADRRSVTVTIRANASDRLIIEVEDSGVGMSAETLSQLFRFGFTTKKDGHGFGLHSSAILAKELGGELRAHSDGLGQGARFTLQIPTGHVASVKASAA
jgi:NO-binding membrane sensor protein with MHYT domain/two-component sensor histidine kinase